MPQLHLSVSEDVAELVRRRAAARGVPVSRLLAELVEREAARSWPAGWFAAVVGSWAGEDPERPDQGAFELRDAL